MAYTSLSASQMDCLKLLITSNDLDQIAAALGVSPPDVERHLDDACMRLGVQSRFEAAIIATELGLIHAP